MESKKQRRQKSWRELFKIEKINDKLKVKSSKKGKIKCESQQDL